MNAYVKSILKSLFPKSALRWRTRKLLRGGVDPDLYLLANIRSQLSGIQGGGRFAAYFSKENSAIDVGACGGEYSCVMAGMFKTVLSIEPTADMALLLRRSLARKCEVVECVMGATVGEVSLRVPKIGGVRMNALSTVADHDFEFSEVGTIDTDVVRQLTIDQLVSDRKLRPSFIKIDVEGYEGNVLLGSMKVIQSCKPVIMIEIEKRHNKGYLEIFTLLESQGYVPFHFRGGKLSLSGPSIAEESFAYLKGSGISGMMEVISSKMSEKYMNNFIFLPMS
jgi:FkbM family methyltransferase